MTQFWTIEQHRADRRVATTFATVSGSGSHRIHQLSSCHFTQRSLTLQFYPRVGELSFNDGRVSIGGVQLEGVIEYELNSPADSIVTAQLDIAIASVDLSVSPPEHFCGIPVRAEIRRYDFLVSDAIRVGEMPRIPGYMPDRYGWMIPDSGYAHETPIRLIDERGILWGNSETNPAPNPQVPAICQNCRNYHGQPYGGNFLVCGMHPYGNGEDCSDFEGKS